MQRSMRESALVREDGVCERENVCGKEVLVDNVSGLFCGNIPCDSTSRFWARKHGQCMRLERVVRDSG